MVDFGSIELSLRRECIHEIVPIVYITFKANLTIFLHDFKI